MHLKSHIHLVTRNAEREPMLTQSDQSENRTSHTTRENCLDNSSDSMIPAPPSHSLAADADRAFQSSATATARDATPPPPPPPRRQGREDEDDGLGPIRQLAAQLERIGAEDFAPLPLRYRLSSRDRLSSREWVKDLGEPDLAPLLPTLFADDAVGDAEDCLTPLGGSSVPMESDWVMVAEHLTPPPQPMPLSSPSNPHAAERALSCAMAAAVITGSPLLSPSTATTRPRRRRHTVAARLITPSNTNIATAPSVNCGSFTPPPLPLSPPSNPYVMEHLPFATLSPSISAAAATRTPSPSSAAAIAKNRPRRRRQIDESRAVEPTDKDVLFGRGGHTNMHPGNVKFRQKALELRSWYELPATTREEKHRISHLLVESVRCEGGRFLERGEETGRWHEVLGSGARRKASQVLREHLRGTRRPRSAGAGGAGGAAAEAPPRGEARPGSVEGDAMGI